VNLGQFRIILFFIYSYSIIMVYMSGGKAARNQASIINRANCGGPKKAGLMGFIGGIGTGGISPGQSRRFCPSNSCNNRDMNTLFGLKCVGNFSNPSQSTARMAARGMF
jgi:hypothetical protein